MAGISHHQFSLDPGGGPYALENVTLGVFLTAQPQHRFSHGSDKTALLPLERGQGWLLPAGSTGICDFEDGLSFVQVSVPQTYLRDAGLQNTNDFKPLVGALDPVLVAMALNAEAFTASDPLYRETMERAFAAHLAKIIAPPRLSAQAIQDARLRRVIDLIHTDIAAPLSLTDLAAAAAMSEAHFSRTFKAATGQSPLQYVIGARLDRAKVLLRTTKLPVAEVAHRVGYSDVSRFGQHFKRKFNMTPAAMR